jgi:hypothetical protein
MDEHSHEIVHGIRLHIGGRGGKYVARGRIGGLAIGETLTGKRVQAAARLRSLLSRIDNDNCVRPSGGRKKDDGGAYWHLGSGVQVSTFVRHWIGSMVHPLASRSAAVAGSTLLFRCRTDGEPNPNVVDRAPSNAASRPKPLTVKQAASASNVSQSLIYDWCRRGLLRHVRLPGRNGRGWKILISECDLVAFLDRHTVEPGQDYDAVALKHIRQTASKASRVTKHGTASP